MSKDEQKPLKIGQLVQHKYVSVLGKVIKPDPEDNKRVIVKPLIEGKSFSCMISNLIAL